MPYKDPKAKNANAAAYRKANREKIATKQRTYYANNKQKCAAYAKDYREENKEALAARKKVYSDANKDKRKAYDEANKDWIKARQRAYVKANRAAYTAQENKRRAMKLNQTPDLNIAEKLEIEFMYLYNQIMPGDWHVDHIVALANGGLHHPANLQILSKFDNLSKGSR